MNLKIYRTDGSYPEIGQRSLEGIAEELSDVAEVEQRPKLEGWSMTLLLNPLQSS